MDPNWNDNQPIYRQLRDRMVALILEGALKEGDRLPSVRAVAADYRLNPLTVLKGYQQLVDENLVEKRRGRGMYVSDGARRLLLAGERERFLNEDWPQILAVINRLGFSSQELFAQTPALTHPAPPPRGSGIPPASIAKAITRVMNPDAAASGPRPVWSTQGASNPCARSERNVVVSQSLLLCTTSAPNSASPRRPRRR